MGAVYSGSTWQVLGESWFCGVGMLDDLRKVVLNSSTDHVVIGMCLNTLI